MDSAVVTGAFTLGGVAFGAALEWLRSAVAARQAAARDRDDLFAALTAACAKLLVAARTWRSLNTVSAKLRQAMYGVMESEVRRPFAVGDDAVAVVRQLMAAAAANGLRHLWPVGVAETIRSDLVPLMSEIAVLAIRMSMTGDTEIKDASVKVSEAVGALAGNLVVKEKDYDERPCLQRQRRSSFASSACPRQLPGMSPARVTVPAWTSS
jgi:hypothetical protein